MFAQVIHELVDLLPHVHPNKRAELHERIAEESAAAAVKTVPPEEPPAVPAAPDTPPTAPPAAA